jgi:hypothetical protein
MALEIWYGQEPENDLGPGDPAIIIARVEDLDAFVHRVLRETRRWAAVRGASCDQVWFNQVSWASPSLRWVVRTCCADVDCQISLLSGA